MSDPAQMLVLFATAFVVGLSGAMAPGPLLAVTITESVRRGPIAGPILMVGHAALEAGLVAALALGLGTFLKNPVVVGWIGLLGGGVLCWLGQDMLRSAPRLSMRAVAGRSARNLHPVAAGALVSLSNPYWTIWWATIGIGYVFMGLRHGPAGVLVFFSGHILSDFAWYTLVSVGVAKGKQVLSDSLYRAVLGVCGLSLVGFGLWFAHAGAVGLAGS